VPAAEPAEASRAGTGAGVLVGNRGLVRGAAGPGRQHLPPGRARPADLSQAPGTLAVMPELGRNRPDSTGSHVFARTVTHGLRLPWS
jgi:hypothetical protein